MTEPAPVRIRCSSCDAGALFESTVARKDVSWWLGRSEPFYVENLRALVCDKCGAVSMLGEVIAELEKRYGSEFWALVNAALAANPPDEEDLADRRLWDTTSADGLDDDDETAAHGTFA